MDYISPNYINATLPDRVISQVLSHQVEGSRVPETTLYHYGREEADSFISTNTSEPDLLQEITRKKKHLKCNKM